METTRHFVSTVYCVAEGAVALHRHDRLDLWVPPGGHVDRDELPREAARREVREEIGRDVALLEPGTGPATGTDLPTPDHVAALPGPECLLLEDVHRYDDGSVGHQHVDFVYFGAVDSRAIEPADGERAAEHWEWFTPADLRADDRLEPQVAELGCRAVERVEP